MKSITLKTGLIIASAGVIFSACKKDPEVVDTNQAGMANIHLHHMVGAQTFAFDTDFTDDFGNTYQWTRAQFYLRVAGFTDHDGNELSGVPSGYHIIDPAEMMVDLGCSDAVTLHNIVWGVGVDSVTNHADPTVYDAANDLSPQSPSMHWSWSNGYIFATLEGRVDINNNGTYDAGENFIFHVGSDAMYRDGMPLHVDTSIPDGGTGTMHLEVDYAKFIEGIDLSVDNSTHTMNNMPLATSVANNFPNVLKLH